MHFSAKANDKNQWLPVSWHLTDTAEIMKLLIRDISGNVIQATKLSDEDFKRVAVFCAAAHDLGKYTPSFQGKLTAYIPSLEKTLIEEGFNVTYNERVKESHHTVAGGWILKQGWAGFIPSEGIINIIAGHHGKPTQIRKKNNGQYDSKSTESAGQKYLNENYFGVETPNDALVGRYKAVWEYCIENALILSNSNKRFIENVKLSTSAQVLITGLIIMADWIASSEEFCPYIDWTEDVPEYDKTRAKMAYDKVNFGEVWEPDCYSLEDDEFKDIFGFSPNSLQKTALDIVNAGDIPGLTVVEAMMGDGKTECALALSQVLATHSRSTGVFFGAPTQASANSIYERVSSWESIVAKGSDSFLAHGKKEYNELFQKISTVSNDEDDSVEEKDTFGINVNHFLSKNHLALIPGFVTGTIDQALSATLKKKFFMLLHLGLCGKVVILDEIHSYDAYMGKYLETLLSWLGVYEVPTILLSATLATDKKKDLISSYTGMKKENINVSFDYPIITYAVKNEDGSYSIAERKFTTSRNTKVTLMKTDKENATIDILRTELVNGGCAGVIMNTVGAAQELYQEAKSTFPTNKVILFHSRFLPEHRKLIEEYIIKHLGKHSKPEDRDGVIVIGTQVIEQSLDLDFDVLISQIAPIDLILQRIGRLHRHKNRNAENGRPKNLMEPKFFLLESDSDFENSSHAYSRYILNKSKDALEDTDIISIPEDIRNYVDNVYGALEITSEKEKFEASFENQKISASAHCMTPPYKTDGTGAEQDFNTLLGSRIDSSASVRNIRYGVNVILLKTDGTYAYDMDGNKIVPLDSIPKHKDVYQIIKENLLFPIMYSQETDNILKEFKQRFAPKWDKNSILKKTDIVFADMDGNISFGIKYIYNRIEGLKKS